MRVVVLGTGTGVGKTYVTCRLAEGLRQHALVRALKPVESGVTDGEWGDAGAIAAAAGHAPCGSPWRFARAVSPHLAARDAGVELEIEAVRAWIVEQEARPPIAQSVVPGAPAHAPHVMSRRVTLIETAGGALSPLSPTAANLDLARALSPALWLLVAPDALGVLHDCRVTLGALGRVPDAVVLSAARPADASSGSNAEELRRLGVANPLCVLGPGAASVAPLVEWLLRQDTQVQ